MGPISAHPKAFPPGQNCNAISFELTNLNPPIWFILIFLDGTTQKAKLGNTKFENPKIRGVIKFEEGDEIEVKWRSNPEKEYLWYPAIIQNINWDYFVCEFKHKGNVNRDIFERPFMRLRNPNPIIKYDDFYTGK